jgi:hypothetical protein
MLYYLENVELSECRTCRYAHCKPRTNRERTLIAHRKLRYFSSTHRLQRLFMSLKIIEHMIWHQSNDMVDGAMEHPSDGKAWKHFNSVYP